MGPDTDGIQDLLTRVIMIQLAMVGDKVGTRSIFGHSMRFNLRGVLSSKWELVAVWETGAGMVQ